MMRGIYVTVLVSENPSEDCGVREVPLYSQLLMTVL